MLRKRRSEYLGEQRAEMGIWEAMEYLNTLVDDSDPDTDLSQIEHKLQTAEAIRARRASALVYPDRPDPRPGQDPVPYGEPQWAVVGDTFPVGCAYSDKIVFPEFFGETRIQPGSRIPDALRRLRRDCGLDNVDLSWGHDEYLYHVVKDYLPDPALYMIRYHSFYPGHREGAYDYLMNDHDREMFEWVRSSIPTICTRRETSGQMRRSCGPTMRDLIEEYFPAKLDW